MIYVLILIIKLMNGRTINKNKIVGVKYNTHMTKEATIKNIKLNNISDSNNDISNITNQNFNIFSK
jgi:hypothetical protein